MKKDIEICKKYYTNFNKNMIFYKNKTMKGEENIEQNKKNIKIGLKEDIFLHSLELKKQNSKIQTFSADRIEKLDLAAKNMNISYRKINSTPR